MATSDQQRADRLAAALRDNLKRRKAQARDHESTRPVSGPEPDGDE